MQDLATLLSDLLSNMTAGNHSMRWLTRGVMVALVVALGWMLVWRVANHST